MLIKNLSKNQIIIASTGVLLVILISALVYANLHKPKKSISTGGQPNVVANRPASADSPADTSTPSSISSNSSAPISLPKPTLAKSSGNNGSVPANSLIEFTCAGQAGLQCTVILTDKMNSSHQIDLGSKLIKDDGYGQTAVIWDWKSLAGNWIVIAKVKDTNNNSAGSDEQNLVVQE